MNASKNWGLTTLGQHIKALCEKEGRSYTIGFQKDLDAHNGDLFQYIEDETGMRADWKNKPSLIHHPNPIVLCWDYNPSIELGNLYRANILAHISRISVEYQEDQGMD